jgi:hypothetical protein
MEVDEPACALALAPPRSALCVGAPVWLVRVTPECEAALDAAAFAAPGIVSMRHDGAGGSAGGGEPEVDVLLDDGAEAEHVPPALLALPPSEQGACVRRPLWHARLLTHAVRPRASLTRAEAAAAAAAGAPLAELFLSRGVSRWRAGDAAAAAAEFAAALRSLPANGAPPADAPPPPPVGAAALVRQRNGAFRAAMVCCVDIAKKTCDVMYDDDDDAAAALSMELDEAPPAGTNDAMMEVDAEEEESDVAFERVLCESAGCGAALALRGWTNLARALLRAGCAPAARAAAGAALAWRPAHAAARYVRALALATPPGRDLDAAADELRAAAALAPRAPEVRAAARDVARERAAVAHSDRRLARAVVGLAQSAAAGAGAAGGSGSSRRA